MTPEAFYIDEELAERAPPNAAQLLKARGKPCDRGPP
jgi:hypothetical protein